MEIIIFLIVLEAIVSRCMHGRLISQLHPNVVKIQEYIGQDHVNFNGTCI